MSASEAIARLRELRAKATAGEWRQHLVDDTTIIAHDGDEIASTWPDGGHDADADFDADTERHEANAAAIVAAMNSLPALLECAEALRALVVAVDEGPASLVIQCKREARSALQALAGGGGE